MRIIQLPFKDKVFIAHILYAIEDKFNRKDFRENLP